MSLNLLLIAWCSGPIIGCHLVARLPGTGTGQVQSGRRRFEVDLLPSGPGAALSRGIQRKQRLSFSPSSRSPLLHSVCFYSNVSGDLFKVLRQSSEIQQPR